MREVETNDKVTSQCFATKGNPFVTLYCGQGATVKVNNAFHGRYITNETDCTFLEDDCIEDHPVTLYDWQVRLSDTDSSETVVTVLIPKI